MTTPVHDNNPSQVSPKQKKVLFYNAESTGARQVKCLAQGHNIVRQGVRTQGL